MASVSTAAANIERTPVIDIAPQAVSMAMLRSPLVAN
jgi:hypothetical protein